MHVHTFTVESNQKVENKLFQRDTVVPELRERRTVQDSNQESSDLNIDNCTQSTSESGHTRTRLERDVNREQHRSPNKSYGTTGGQQSQPGATAKSS